LALRTVLLGLRVLCAAGSLSRAAYMFRHRCELPPYHSLRILMSLSFIVGLRLARLVWELAKLSGQHGSLALWECD
jgi:hypothetical protein